MMKRHKDLQPWLDYFTMLQKFEREGFLEVSPEKHEAYVTQPALYTIAGCSFSARVLEHGTEQLRVMTAVRHTVLRIRAYAAFRSQHTDYLSRPFALHTVSDGERHDLLHTIVVTTRRAWWKLWLGKTDRFEVITY